MAEISWSCLAHAAFSRKKAAIEKACAPAYGVFLDFLLFVFVGIVDGESDDNLPLVGVKFRKQKRAGRSGESGQR